MPSAKFKNSTFIPGLNALGALVVWLKPGILALRFGQLKCAIEPVAVNIERENQKLIDDHVLFDQEPPRDENDKRPADERPRIRRTKDDGAGNKVLDFGTKLEEYRKKFRDLMDDETEITFTRLITEADVEHIEKQRRESKPKGPDGQTIELPPVDFSALIPFMEQPTPTAAGPAKTAAAAEERA